VSAFRRSILDACYHAIVRLGGLAFVALGGCQLVLGLDDPRRPPPDASPHDAPPGDHDGMPTPIDASGPPLDAPMGMCFDGDSARPIVAPMAGELVLDELMPDPELASNVHGQWIELRATASVDLNGIRFADGGSGSFSIDEADCLRFDAGDFVLIASSDDIAENGDLPTVDAILGFELPVDGTIVIHDPMDTVLQTTNWFGAVSGTSFIIDTPNLCPAPAGTTSYNGTDIGTPRAANVPATCP
jgi:hypothetical protein